MTHIAQQENFDKVMSFLSHSNRIEQLKRFIAEENTKINDPANPQNLVDALIASRNVMRIELNYLINGAA